MQTTIQYIEKELEELYSKTEIYGFVRIIFEYVCGLDYTGMLLQKNEKISAVNRKKIEEIVSRLKHFEPIQYILGETEFFDLKLKVNPAVLIPRPETEELVQLILETVTNAEPSILDIGTGSGCIALALKSKLKHAKIFGTDISESALQIAQLNAAKNNLDVSFFQSNILTWENQKWNKFDVIVSNPPYVRESEKLQMQPNVLEFEPAKALFVPDNNSLLFYRRITEFAIQNMSRDGFLFFEINENLANEMLELLESFGFKNVELKNDINAKRRMIYATK
jgi:release factor glutamine methyltransferase